ncbi:MAG: diguanylate cyclase, partial [Burkholderiaceae bacterium]
RFGGEEFVLLLDNPEPEALLDLLGKTMRQFRAMRFGAGEDLTDDCTFSAGIAWLGADGTDFESLVRVADLRMYRAKAAGRARICDADF